MSDYRGLIEEMERDRADKLNKERENKMQTTEGILRIEDIQNELGNGYSVHSLETEVYREYTLPCGLKYRIDDPKFLITRKGGSTHRIVCEGGLTHCIPWEGSTTVVWQNLDPLNPCEF
jgi:hypothetical protein